METIFSTAVLAHILDQSILYQCACPAQVCATINQQRALFDYQSNCLNLSDTDRAVHQRIADVTRTCHALMEKCLTDILCMEGWDMTTFDMPESLKTRIVQSLK